jgi:hypothetical protein
LKDYVTLIATSISAIVLIVAAFLAAWLSRENEHTRWLREQRLEVYCQWLLLFEERMILLEDITKQWAKDEEALGRLKAKIKVLESEGELAGKPYVPLPEPGSEGGGGTPYDEDIRRQQLVRFATLNKILILSTYPVRDEAIVLQKLANEVADSEEGRSSPDWVYGLARFYEVVRKELGVR